MMHRVPVWPVPSALIALVLTGACAQEQAPLGLLPERAAASSDASHAVALCHDGTDGPERITVAAAARPAHESHGDHVMEMFVDAGSSSARDGIHFARIGDAIAEARAIRIARGEHTRAGCRITITVAEGVYRGSSGAAADPSWDVFPLVVDVPAITLQGALVMEVDASGRATPGSNDAAASVLLPSPPLATVGMSSAPILVVNGRTDGPRGDDVVVQGFVFRSGHAAGGSFGGLGILSLRVDGLAVRGNRFEPGFSESVDLRASSARVEQNHFEGGAGTCDMCLAGPGSYRVSGNRLLAGGIPGILIVPAVLLPVPTGIEQYTLPTASTVDALLLNNEVRDHLRTPVGVGMRVGAIGVGAPNVAGTAHVEARGNVLVNNRFGVIVDAAFPIANTLRRGDIDLVLADNTFSGSCQNDLLVSLSRHTTGLELTNQPYLLDSGFSLTLGDDLAWQDAWYSHPSGFGNLLTVDGEVIGNGKFHAYDASRTCTS